MSGTDKDESTLSVSSGAWSGTPAPTYSYQWKRCSAEGNSCSDIGGHSTTYALTRTRTLVTRSLPSSPPVTPLSPAAAAPAQVSVSTAVIDATSPASTVVPTISGETMDGSTLSATTGSWTGSPAPTYSYQWQRSSGSEGSYVNIVGATSSTYVLTDADAGYGLRVVVTASNAPYSGGSAVSADSSASAVVRAAPVHNTTAPVVNGTLKDGSTLSVSTGSWTGSPAPSYTYQWQRCEANGTNYSNISGATSSSYTLTDADAGHAIVAK